MEVEHRGLSAVEHRDGFDYLQPQPYSSKGTGESFEGNPPFGLMGRPRGPTSGAAPNAIVYRDGPQGFVTATTDPRYQDLLPNLGDGAGGIYAHASIGGSVQASYLAFFAAGGDKPEGTLHAAVKTAVGTTTIEVNPSTGDVTITHAGGAVVVVKGASVELGAASGGHPLMKFTEFAVAWETLKTNGEAIGLTVPPLTGVATTKVNGT